MTVRVRFAPSPTGALHLGGARTALHNWLFARHHGGSFLLRIEDTDQERSTEQSVDGIIDGLSWLGIDSDEPALFQSSRKQAYLEAALRLEEEGKAYRCYCDKETLEQMREEQRQRGEKPRYDRRCLDKQPPDEDQPYVLRFLTPREGSIGVTDLVKGRVTVANDEMDDLVILRSDGWPTYNFVVVMDDAHMKITHVIRGDDHLNNTFRQVHIYVALGYSVPSFAHLPLIKGLSKRLGSASVQAYRERGFLAEAVVNYIARLGWSYGDQEIFTTAELIDSFDLDGVAKSPAAFDEAKLTWLNEHYLKTLEEEEVARRLLPFLEACGYQDVAAGPRIAHLVSMLKERSKTLVEMAEQAAFAFKRPDSYSEKAVKKWIKANSLELLEDLLHPLGALQEFTADALESLFKMECENRDVALGKIAQPIRICLTGDSVSPPLFDTMAIIGKDEVLNRMRIGIEALATLQ